MLFVRNSDPPVWMLQEKQNRGGLGEEVDATQLSYRCVIGWLDICEQTLSSW